MRQPLNIFVPHSSDLLTDHLPHGDGLLAHALIASLARRGHHLHVATQRVELQRPLPSNVTIYPIRLKKQNSMFSRLDYMIRVRRLFGRLHSNLRFDLVHQLNPVFTGISLCMIGVGLPLVLGPYVAEWPEDPDSISAQSALSTKSIGFLRRFLATQQQQNASALIVVNPAALNRMPNLESIRDRIHTVPYGLDTELFSPKGVRDSESAAPAEVENLSILFFANVVERKGIFVLIEAFSEIAREVPGSVLRIAGAGPALDEAKRRAASLDCRNRIEFLGQKSRQDAPEIYRDCAVYCLPSCGEPYGMTTVEAMACGKPVVVTDAGGLSHLVREDGGRKVPVGDSASLAKELIDLLRDPVRRAAMGRFNRHYVESTMTWERVTSQVEEVYRLTLEKAFKQPSRQRNDVNVMDRVESP